MYFLFLFSRYWWMFNRLCEHVWRECRLLQRDWFIPVSVCPWLPRRWTNLHTYGN